MKYWIWLNLLDKKEYKGINLAHGEKQWLEIAMLLDSKAKSYIT